MTLYVIANKTNDRLLWNVTQGWVHFEDCDTFTIDEKTKWNLPADGKWLELRNTGQHGE